MVTLRPEQRTTVDRCKEILLKKNIVYLAAEPRVGKGLMSFTISYELGYNYVYFITKKINIVNAKADLVKFGQPDFHAEILNFEQSHKIVLVRNKKVLFIIDEAHSIGAMPKPSKRTKCIRDITYQNKIPIILMSGTPTPETPSQIFHQFWVSAYSPFGDFVNFYKWAHQYVDIRTKMINGYKINDYTRALEHLINPLTEPYMVRFSQEDAGFESFVEEEILTIPIDDRMYKLMAVLKRDKVYTMKCGDTIVADTPVKLQSLFHQLSSGCVKVDDNYHVLDYSKAYYIKSRFAGHKIAIYYKYIAEGNMLREIFTNHTDDQHDFNSHYDRTFIRQMVSGREGVDLHTADCMVAFTIDFSATTYWQMRARIQSHDRKKSAKLYWIFSENGLERFIHKAVVKKLPYTVSHFKKDFLSKKPLFDGSRVSTPVKSNTVS